MTALEVLHRLLSDMDRLPSFGLDKTLGLRMDRLSKDEIPGIDKAVELLMAYADPFDDDTPTHRLYGRLYRWCQSVTLETQRDAVVWAIDTLSAIQPLPSAVTKVTINGWEYDQEDIAQWLERR